MNRPSLALSATLLLLVTACGDGGPDTVLHLRVVPSKTTAALLLAQLDSIELVLDSTIGFSNVPSGATQVGAFAIADADADGQPELIWSHALTDALPDLWLTPGSNIDKKLTISAYGRSKGQIMAKGSVSEIAFTPGAVREIAIPLAFDSSPPPPTGCAALKCGADKVCSEQSGKATCIDDCRVYGCPVGNECDADGFCQPCPGGKCAPPTDCKTFCADVCGAGKDPQSKDCIACMKKCEGA